MSAFKSILVPVSDAESGSAPLESALHLAGRFGSHVTGLHVRVDPTTAVPLVGEGMSGAMVEEMINMAESQGTQRAKAARTAFDALCSRHGAPIRTDPGPGLSAEWVDQVGREEDVVAWRGRLSDLVVLGHPRGESEMPALMTLNSALLGSGKPLLLCPPEPPAQFGRSVAIAWNGSAEASRAVGWAMPLLREAAAVTILAVSEHSDSTVDAPASELLAYLAWNGVTATVTTSQASNTHAGEELLRQTQKSGADLLVMGAYTHSRLRQLILGGVTRHVLSHAPMHCLMCH
ncbi:Universal stress protein UspA and related nucleotide-binding protein [Candidatus Terasakiella magnetica]|nr:Universal stress protein UspA and related nucleotide-binding protein [Candidatus Terasakiella magnetica]